MKKLTIALFAILLLPVISYAWDVNKMSVRELTTNAIKTPSGGTYTGTTSGDARYLRSGHSTQTGVFGNMSATTVTIGGHTFTTMTTTINGVLRHLLKY